MTETTTIRLSDAQVAAFHRDGFLAIEQLTTADEIAAMREVYDRLFGRRDGFDKGDHLELSELDDEGRETLPQILSPDKYAPELASTLARRNALALARQLLGPEAEHSGDHAIMKPPGLGAPTPWHQDEAYWNPAVLHTALSIWMPLQEATVENGCMHFVPGSHVRDVVPHHLASADAHALEVDSSELVADEVACPIPAGGATIHHCRTVHYAGPNVSTTPRRAYIMGFHGQHRPLPVARDFSWQRPEWTE